MQFVSRIPNIALTILAGLLLWLSWPPGFGFPLIFVAFIPFFLIERNISHSQHKKKGWRFFGFLFIGLLIWNLLTTYWIWYATAAADAGIASVGAWVANTIFMTLPWIGYYRIKRRYGLRLGLIAFISFWLCFEWIHLTWELSWPWLTIGNVFAKFPQLVQWYEFTGVSGGTFWVLVCNILIYKLLFLKIDKRKLNKVALTLLFVVPLLYSIIRYATYQELGEDVKVTVVQPNIDPYGVLDNQVEVNQMLSDFIPLATEKSDTTTDYIVFPEGAFLTYPWLSTIERDRSVKVMRRILEDVPNAKIIVGTDLLTNYGSEKKSITARYSERGNFYYDVYNAALQIQRDEEITFYGKSKLVPGVERIPYPKYSNFLSGLAIDLAGSAGSRATQKERSVFESTIAKVAPSICYESIYGDYMNEFVKNGAELIFIITNDGWWKDTPGYKQHLHYARLRAIENRRSVARSANTGVSGFINQRGDILQKSEWWVADSLSETIKKNQKLTLYTRVGDVLYRVGGLLTCLFLLISFVHRWTNGFKYR